MALSRKLELYELICAGSNINFMLQFESDTFKKEHLIEAFKKVTQKHPYYRTTLFKLEDGSYEFRQKEDAGEEDLGFVEQFFYDYAEELDDDWRTYLVKIGSKKRDLTKSLAFFEIRSFEKQHQLYGSINHAGIDGPGVFTTIKDLCFYLDSILSKTNLDEKIESNSFHNIHNNYDKFDLELLKKEKSLIENYIDGVKSVGKIDENESMKPFISSVFYQFDEKLTKLLIENCKKTQTTIQGVLSTALAVSLINDTIKTLNKDETIRLVNSCPCNMRSNLGLTNDDLVCGSAALIWLDEISGSNLIWDLAKTTTKNIKQKLEENYGYKWWMRLKNGLPVQNYSLMGSSMGVVSLNEKSFKNIKINDLRFLGSSYELPKNAINFMTHAFTFMDRFTFNISYTFPTLSKEWAENYGNNVVKVLESYARMEDPTKDKTTIVDLITKLDKYDQ